jgi:hypothetical protein
MTPAGERDSLTFLVEAVGRGKKTAGGVRPAFMIVTPYFQCLG